MLWRQFERLGEMMGDGLHLEADGKWIAKEYRQLRKILVDIDPEVRAEMKRQRQERNKGVDKLMTDLLQQKKCPKDNGQLVQTRSGSKRVQCSICKAFYKAKYK